MKDELHILIEWLTLNSTTEKFIEQNMTFEVLLMNATLNKNH